MTILTSLAKGRAHWAPSTRPGRVACWLGLAFIGWFVLNQTIVVGQRDAAPEGLVLVLLIGYGFAGLALGLAAGVVAAFAALRRHERAILVFVAMLPAVLVVAFILGELLVPH